MDTFTHHFCANRHGWTIGTSFPYIRMSKRQYLTPVQYTCISSCLSWLYFALQALLPLKPYTKVRDYLHCCALCCTTRLTGAKYFTKFNVHWGYHNIRICEGDKWKGAIITNRGLYEPKVMYFGMTNSPVTFQALMNSIFTDLIAAGKMAVYMDDLLIYAANLVQLHQVTCEVLARLLQYDLYLKPEKCKFKKQEMEYLGMII